MKNLFSYFQKNQSNLWFQTNRTRLRANYFNTQKNNRIYSNLFLALIYMQVGKNHTSLFHRGSFSVLLFRSRFTAGFFSFFASFGFFVFVPSVAVPFFTVVTTSTVTEKRKRKKYLKQISWHFRPHLITKYQKPSPCILYLQNGTCSCSDWYSIWKSGPNCIFLGVVHISTHPVLFAGKLEWFFTFVAHILIAILLIMSCPYWYPLTV